LLHQGQFSLTSRGYGLIDELHDRGLKVFADLSCTTSVRRFPMMAYCSLKQTRIIDCGLFDWSSSYGGLTTAFPDTEHLGVDSSYSLTDDDSDIITARRSMQLSRA